MPEIDPQLIRSTTCRRAFRLMMWGFLFLMPLLVPFRQAWAILPLVVGWTLAFAALSWVRGLHPSVGRLRVAAGVGMLLSVGRAGLAAVSKEPSKAGEAMLFVLFGASVLVGIYFVWTLCGLVEAMAAHAGSKAVARDANYRPMLYLIAAVLPCLWLVLPDGGGLRKLGVLIVGLLGVAVMSSLMMGLMSTTIRMCAQLTATDEETPAADPDPTDAS